MSSDTGIQKRRYRLVRLNGDIAAEEAGLVVIEFTPWKHVKSARLSTANPNGILRMCVKMYEDSAFAKELGSRDITEHSGGCRLGETYFVGDSVTFEPVKKVE